MIANEVLRRIRRVEIVTRAMVRETFAGRYESIFKGKGMDFDEVREYSAGDDIRTIDWNVTARTGWLHVKKFVEERELTVLILLDASGSFSFGTVGRTKRQLAAEVAAVLAFSAARNNDKVGLLIFTDAIEEFVPPRKGDKHVLRLIREILEYRPNGKGTDISLALKYASRLVRRHSIMFLISDFMGSGFEKWVRVASKKHDLVALTIRDPREMELPVLGLVEIEDGETGERLVIDLRSHSAARRFADVMQKKREETKEMFRRAQIDFIDLQTDSDYVEPLIRFFALRRRRMEWHY